MIEIISFSLKTFRCISMPGKHQKGNLLSTFFILFLGISEKIMAFEKKISCNTCLLTHRYVRQCFIITASLLFILASCEWPDAALSRESLSGQVVEKTARPASVSDSYGNGTELKVSTPDVRPATDMETLYVSDLVPYQWPAAKTHLELGSIRI